MVLRWSVPPYGYGTTAKSARQPWSTHAPAIRAPAVTFAGRKIRYAVSPTALGLAHSPDNNAGRHSLPTWFSGIGSTLESGLANVRKSKIRSGSARDSGAARGDSAACR
jgi:hypothetical protein